MSCHHIEPFIVDFARGATSDQVREDALNRHLLGCPNCTGIDRTRARDVGGAPSSGRVNRRTAAQSGPGRSAARDLRPGRRGSPPHAHAPLWMGAIAATVIIGTVATLLVRLPSRIPQAVDSSAPPAAAVSVAGASLPSAAAPATSGDERPTRTRPAPPVAEEPGDVAAAADFMLWPGAAAWPPFESGELVRVTLPLDALPALGFASPPAADAVVQADVLVGQDGFARAIRLVQ